MRSTISFIDTTAFRTLSRGISGVNHDNHHASKFSLVLDLCYQIVERPARPCLSLRLSNPNPLPNARQIFKGNRLLRAFSLLGYALADGVVYILPEKRSLRANGFQNPFGRSGAFFLQSLALAVTSATDRINLRPALFRTILLSRHLNDTQINPQYVFNLPDESVA